jgi:lipopolysaccharide transport system permease protein
MNPATIENRGVTRATGAIIQPRLTIRASAGWRALDLAQVWRYRDLLFTLAVRDLKLRYKQTVLGVAWVVLQPLIGAGIFSFVFGRIAKLPSDGVPYMVFSYTGMIAWTVFSSTLAKTSACLVGNAHLVSKVFFPRLILPLSTVYSTLVDFAIALGLMSVLMAVYGVVPGAQLLLMPFCLLTILAFAMGVGLLACGLTVRYRDVQYILPVALQFMLYASPVGYSVSAVPENLRQIYMLNPLAPLLEAFRWTLLGTGELDARHLAYAAFVACALLTAGAFAFRRMERTFADVI